MEADEARTLAAIKAWRCEIFDPLREDYHGRIVKLMGDGAIVGFRTDGDCKPSRNVSSSSMATGRAPAAS